VRPAGPKINLLFPRLYIYIYMCVRNVPYIVLAYTDSFLNQFVHEMPVIGTFLLAIKYKDAVKFLF